MSEKLGYNNIIISVCLDVASMYNTCTCKMWSFYGQACGQEDCSQTMTMTTDEDNTGQ